MVRLGDVAEKIRSKNAGPFWLTIDIFCNSGDSFEQVCNALATEAVAAVFARPPGDVKRFEIRNLNVIKFSLPRPVVQGDIKDPDMHGASWAALLQDLEIHITAPPPKPKGESRP